MSALEAKEITQKILENMGVEATLDIDSEDPIYISISSPDSALIIGKGGENLKALQNIVNTMYRHNNEEGGYVGIDIAGYRKERVEKVQALAQEIADRVRETGNPEHLKPMNAFERRSVHTLLSEDPDLITDSEGEGVNRHIVIRKR